MGETITYTFTVTNDGNQTLTAVTVTDNFTVGSNDNLSAIICDDDDDSDNVVATLAPGASFTCSATYTLDQDDLDNETANDTATATAKDADDADVTDTASEAVALDPNPSVDITKLATANEIDPDGTGGDDPYSVEWNDDGDGIPEVGETITYTFTVTNDGNQTLTAVTVTDNFTVGSNDNLSAIICDDDDDFDNVVATLAPGASFTCSATGPGPGRPRQRDGEQHRHRHGQGSRRR